MNTVPNTSQFKCNVFLALTACVCVAANAAETSSVQPAELSADTIIEKRTVRYSDLDLRVQSDVARLYRRIERAAAAVCGGRMPPLALRSPRYGSCRGKALADAINDVNAPELTAYHESKRRGTPALKAYARTTASER